MTTHAFINTTKCLEPNEVEQIIKNVIRNKFDDVLTLKTNTENNEICNWIISFDQIHMFPIRLKTSKQLDFTRQDNLWSAWAQLIFQDALAMYYEGKVFDQEYPKEDLIPHINTHDTFVKYLEEINIYHSPAWRKAIIQIEINALPDQLKKF